MKDQVKVAIVQHPPVFLNIERSLQRARTLIAEAAAEGADVIVFPETWLPGYPVWLDAAPGAGLWDHPPAKALYRILVENAIAIPGERLDVLLEVAGDAEAYVVMGAHERAGGTLYNTMLYLDRDGRTYSLHRKLMPTYTERLVWGRGDGRTLDVVTTDWGNLGGLICWEHWMPLARAAMHARQETIHVAQWPWVRELHQIASRHYAFEGQCFVLAAGSVLTRQDVLDGYHSLEVDSEALEILEQIPGDAETYLLKGGSAVIGPDAGYVVEPVFEEAGILYADLELDRVIEGHLTLDTDGHYARPDVFHLAVNDQPQSGVTFRSLAQLAEE
jgi:predicted amidohydrolase